MLSCNFLGILHSPKAQNGLCIKPGQSILIHLMRHRGLLKPFLAVLMLLSVFLMPARLWGCSMYKVSFGGKTMMGCNEDAWRLSSRIWFEQKRGEAELGAAFTGSRMDGTNGVAPQSGMNEAGLSYSRLSAYTPGYQPQFPLGRKTISNPTQYLKDILHSCRNVREVKRYIEQFDHSYFAEDVMIYVDKTGEYLVVEPYSTTLGQEAKYVLSNFCPSETSTEKASKLERYRNGLAFRNGQCDSSLAFCAALSDTMHVCREKHGDGTLLTSIWDTEAGKVNLYFYHDYTHTVQFDIAAELKKGDHMLEIPPMFPSNAEFEELANFQIPQNNRLMMFFVMCSGLFFFFTSAYFLVFMLGKGKSYPYINLALLQIPLGLGLGYYMYVLASNMSVFYFPAPYVDKGSMLVTWSSYTPFAVLLLLAPMLYFNGRILKNHLWKRNPTILFTLNSLILSVLCGLFVYWGFFDVI